MVQNVTKCNCHHTVIWSDPRAAGTLYFFDYEMLINGFNYLRIIIQFHTLGMEISYLKSKISCWFGNRRYKPVWGSTTQEACCEHSNKRIHQIWTQKHISSDVADIHLRPWKEPAWVRVNGPRIARRGVGKIVCPSQHHWITPLINAL